MKCPNCGAELPKDNLYCEKCGAEFQIVPDFEVEVDGEIDKTLRTLNNDEEEQSEDDYYYDDIEFDSDPNIISSLLNSGKGNKVLYIFFALILVLVIAIITIQGKKIAKQNTLEYQVETARQLASEKKYLSAIPYLEKAYKMSGENTYLFSIADYYYSMGRDNDAIFTLEEIIGSDTSSAADVETAYRKTITLYEGISNYQKLTELITNCPIESLKNEYKKYIVSDPVFSVEEGTYEEETVLKLSNPNISDGTVYYTTDGTDPSETSTAFAAPIFLENGNYTIKAICYNPYGVASEIVTKKYHIEIAFEFKPVILTESGSYSEPTQIKADVPATERYYYTTDGSDPTQKSSRYTGPIQMPYGKSSFKFVSFAMDGTQSLVVTMDYDLHHDGLQPEDCYNALRVRLVERELLTDASGYKEGVDGYYSYIFANLYDVEKKGSFYFYVEYLNDFEGNSVKTGNIYAVNIKNPDDIEKVTGGSSISGYILNPF